MKTIIYRYTNYGNYIEACTIQFEFKDGKGTFIPESLNTKDRIQWVTVDHDDSYMAISDSLDDTRTQRPVIEIVKVDWEPDDTAEVNWRYQGSDEVNIMLICGRMDNEMLLTRFTGNINAIHGDILILPEYIVL